MSDPAYVVGAVTELTKNNYLATGFEGIPRGANTFYMASALCNVFGGQQTAYAVTNASTTDSANIASMTASGTVVEDYNGIPIP